MNQEKLIIRLDGIWALIHESIVAELIGVNEDFFITCIAKKIPKETVAGEIYYANFDINWRIKQLLNISYANEKKQWNT